MINTPLILSILIAYLLGNLSGAMILSRLRGDDIRKHGSGNAGTTNVLRSYGTGWAVATLLMDVLKGVAAVLIGRALYDDTGAYAAAVMVVVGHIWPAVWGFKGGKGIATALGVLLTVDWRLGLLALAVALAVMFATQRVSPGSIVGAIAAPFLAWKLVPGFVPYVAVLALIVIIKHWPNIKRIFKGEEPKVNFKKKDK
ncbi:MAG: glycerol-3-phosphate 1-O-acyltransferase PlsY [Firmicutes bacterium]|nr:glycerol-3-phosphate 1-O-acyltransferase PlsY [Bacillota bacterium]